MWGNKKKKSEGLVWRLLWLICLIFVFLLLIANISPLIAPDRFWVPAFMGLAYPALVVITFIFSIVLAIKNVRKAILPLLAIFSGFGLLNHSFSFRNHSMNFPEEETELKIMTYNVRLFDLYSWKNPGIIKDSIVEYVNEIKPDVLCMQEFYKDTSNAFNTEEAFLEHKHFKFKHIDYFQIKYGIYHFGLAMFSKYPIINSGSIKNENGKISGNYVIWSDIVVNEDTIRIYNTHLQSIKFSAGDEELFASQTSLSKDDFREQSGNLMRKLKSAFIARARQVRFIKEELEECPHPYFICGDFNDTPVSYAYRIMRGNLRDAFLDAGSRGFGKTYRGIYPSFRIDYIFYPEEYEASNFTIGDKKFSDHFPVYCNFRKKKEE